MQSITYAARLVYAFMSPLDDDDRKDIRSNVHPVIKYSANVFFKTSTVQLYSCWPVGMVNNQFFFHLADDAQSRKVAKSEIQFLWGFNNIEASIKFN